MKKKDVNFARILNSRKKLITLAVRERKTHKPVMYLPMLHFIIGIIITIIVRTIVDIIS